MRAPKQLIEEIEKDAVSVLASWQKDPALFCLEVLGFAPQVWQRTFMQAIADSRGGKIPERRFAIRSGTGVGKSSAVACLILWHLTVFPDSKIGVTAPASPQLRSVLWPECRKWAANVPAALRNVFDYDVQVDRILLGNNFAVARTARDGKAESMQGLHAGNIMMIFEEASGVDDDVFLASQGVMAEDGAITILIGNPTRTVGWFYDAFHMDAHKYWRLRVGCDQSERVSRKYISDMLEKHGEDSYEYKVRVLGEFHEMASGTVIPRMWIDEAAEREVDINSDWIVWGVDVSDGRDKSGLSKRCGNHLLEVPKSWGGVQIMQLVDVIADEYWSTKDNYKPDEICVDAIGMGTAFAQRLKQVLSGEPVRIVPVYVSSRKKGEVDERYVSLRVELWARGRKWFESPSSRIPKGCVDLTAQLCSVEWEVNPTNGKWQIIDKAAGGSSPEQADSFLLTFAGSKRDRSLFTKDSKGRKIAQQAAVFGVGSATYLQSEVGYAPFNRNSYTSIKS